MSSNREAPVISAILGVITGLIILAVLFFASGGAEAANTTGPRWVIISDSVASAVLEPGVVPTADMSWPNRAQGLTPITTTLLSGGETGYVYNPNPARILVESVPALAPQGVILALGTNDFGTGQNIVTLQANVKAMVARLKALGVPKVICMTPIKRWDMKTRRGPNPGQVSAYGYTLVPVTGVNRLTYSGAIALACTAAGADVILGYGAPTVLGFTHYTPALAGTTIFQYLSTEGHRVVAEWMVNLMRIRGVWP